MIEIFGIAVPTYACYLLYKALRPAISKASEGIEKGIKSGSIALDEQRKNRIIQNAQSNNVEDIFKAGKYFETEEKNLEKALLYYNKGAHLGCTKCQRESIIIDLQLKKFHSGY